MNTEVFESDFIKMCVSLLVDNEYNTEKITSLLPKDVSYLTFTN